MDEGSFGMGTGSGARDCRNQLIFKGLSPCGTTPNVLPLRRIWVVVGPANVAGAERNLTIGSPAGGARDIHCLQFCADVHSGSGILDHLMSIEIWRLLILRCVGPPYDHFRGALRTGDQGDSFGYHGCNLA
jgi:hypothetical protein